MVKMTGVLASARMIARRPLPRAAFSDGSSRMSSIADISKVNLEGSSPTKRMQPSKYRHS
jgi:hypothetical protein